MEVFSPQRCNVCNQVVNNARVLECSHCFCLKCLESSDISKELSTCPICQVEYKHPQKGLEEDKIPEELTDLKESHCNCDSCNVNQEKVFCIECSLHHCSACLEHCNRIPTTSKHKLPLLTWLLDSSTTGNSICTEHSKLLTLFCENCKSVLCDQCLTLSHNNHKTSSIHQRFDSVKLDIAEKLKIKEGLAENINSNLNEARDTIHDHKLKASNLKKEIQKRGTNIKKVIDSIVAKLVKDVDEELMQHLKDADDVMKELKNVEAISKEHIESLKQQLDNLDFKNMGETSHIPDNCDDIPKYSKNFDVSFINCSDESRIDLETIFGTIRKAPKLRLAEEIKVNGTYTSFASNHDIYFCNATHSQVDVIDSVEMDVKSSYDFQNVISKVSGMLVINGMLFVLGCEGNLSNIKVIKIDSLLKCQPLVIYKMSYNPGIYKLTKSYCQQNILLILSTKLILLSQSGVVMEFLTLTFNIKNALQLDGKRYVVCAQCYDVYIINDRSEVYWRYSPTNDCHKFNFPCLAADNYGNIYMGERNILVLDHELSFRSFHVFRDINENLLEISYDKVKDMLLVLVEVSNNISLLMLKV